MEMANASGQKFVFEFSRIPLLSGATTYAAEFVFPGGAANNKLHFEPDVTFHPALKDDQQMLLWDPQTSGGLLLAVPPERAATFEAACAERSQSARQIGYVAAGRGIEVLL